MRISRSPSARLKPSCDIPSRVQPLGEAEPLHQVGGRALEHAGADAALDILARLALEDHASMPACAQQMAEQQAGRAGADDGDLGAPDLAHAVFPRHALLRSGNGPAAVSIVIQRSSVKLSIPALPPKRP